ncbi:1-acyl-sn-glycerol-3-phosphate acyltransferase [uncultured Algimonas sp.]|uniref:1-acyl-sn-glycerol-3-phosphate acyltransferase n=1 Tax=uncultured Algimonas sp. TaxID=1547920 RepID=UPI002634C5AB|nr:1-acyl-sn-glycerol-3-phosphate acyltransferase [uncultured Algimonas sp.]
MHIVEQLIQERAPKLIGRPRLWRTVRPLLYRLLAYDAAVFLADAVRPMSGHAAFRMVANHISPRTAVEGLHHIPRKGACIVVANHPTGLADGLAVFQAIRDRRRDHVFLANADALRVVPKGDDIIIPVEWVPEKRSLAKTRETLLAMRKAIEAGQCIVIFPSGRLARISWRGLREQPWESSAAMVAKKYGVPVIPLRIEARNSPLYYTFHRISPELRDITLFREMLNKKHRLFRLTFGEAVAPETLPDNADAATALLRKKAFSL